MTQAIGAGMWSRIHYTLRDGRGNELEKTEAPVEFVFGYSDLLPGLEAALEGMRQGDVVNVSLQPEDAYGTRDETNVFEVPKEEFPEGAEIEEGAEFEAEGEDGTRMTMHVVEVRDDNVLVDANHPLAGETLNFLVNVLEVRPATEDEVLVARAASAEGAEPLGEPS